MKKKAIGEIESPFFFIFPISNQKKMQKRRNKKYKKAFANIDFSSFIKKKKRKTERQSIKIQKKKQMNRRKNTSKPPNRQKTPKIQNKHIIKLRIYQNRIKTIQKPSKNSKKISQKMARAQ
jgi:hypothetical protein